MKKILMTILGAGLLVLGGVGNVEALTITFDYSVNDKIIYEGKTFYYDDAFIPFTTTLEINTGINIESTKTGSSWEVAYYSTESVSTPMTSLLMPKPEWATFIYNYHPLSGFLLHDEASSPWLLYSLLDQWESQQGEISWKYTKSMTSARIPVDDLYEFTNESMSEFFTKAMNNQLEFEYYESSVLFNRTTASYVGGSFGLTGIAVISNISTAAPVPEPSTMFLLSFGLIGVVGFRKRIRKS